MMNNELNRSNLQMNRGALPQQAPETFQPRFSSALPMLPAKDSVSIQFGAFSQSHRDSAKPQKPTLIENIKKLKWPMVMLLATLSPSLSAQLINEPINIPPIATAEAETPREVAPNENPTSTQVSAEEFTRLVETGEMARNAFVRLDGHSYILGQMTKGDFFVVNMAEETNQRMTQALSSDAGNATMTNLDVVVTDRLKFVREATNAEGSKLNEIQRVFEKFHRQKQANPLEKTPTTSNAMTLDLIKGGFIQGAEWVPSKSGIPSKISLTLNPLVGSSENAPTVKVVRPETDALNEALKTNNIKLEVDKIDYVTSEYPTVAFLGGFLTIILIAGLILHRVNKGKGVKSAKTFQSFSPKELKFELSEVGGLNKGFEKDLRKRIKRLRKDHRKFITNQFITRMKKRALAIPLLKNISYLTNNQATELQQEELNTDKMAEVKPSIPYVKDPAFQMLFHGSTGTGKTMLATAIAKEVGSHFISINGSDFIEEFVGIGAKRVKGLFIEARKNAPCVVFIDEIDAIIGKRDFNANSGGGGEERQQTVNALLAELDGLNALSGVTVIGATNAPLSALEPAILRYGRLEAIEVPVPKTDEQRMDIMKKVLEAMEKKMKAKDPEWEGPLALFSTELSAKEKKSADSKYIIDMEEVAERMQGASGATIKGAIEEAIEMAREKGEAKITTSLLNEGLTRQSSGKPNLDILNDPNRAKDRELVAGHESGHALATIIWNHVARIIEPDNPNPAYKLAEFSMMPRDKSLGHILPIPTKKGKQHSLLDVIGASVIRVAGRAMEQRNGNNVLNVTEGGMMDWEQIKDMLEQFMHSGGVRGFNTTTLQHGSGFTGKPQLSPKQLVFIDDFMERTLGTVVQVFEKIPEDQLNKLFQSALDLPGDLGPNEAEPFFREALQNVDFDALAEIVNEQVVETTKLEMEEPAQKAIAKAMKRVNEAKKKTKSTSAA